MPETSAQCAVASPKPYTWQELVALYRLSAPAIDPAASLQHRADDNDRR
jgi:hypothetical protein